MIFTFLKESYWNKQFARDLVIVVLVIYLLSMTIIFENDYNSYINDHFYNVISIFEKWLENPIFNLFSIFIIVIIGAYIVYLLKSKKGNIVHLLISLYFIYEVWFNSKWLSVHICGTPIEFKWIIVVLLVLFAIIEIINIKKFICSKYKVFCDDEIMCSSLQCHNKGTNKDDMLPVGWDQFEDNLTNLILGEDVSKESFAIGICGEWGTGKTTFLENLEVKLRNTCFVIRFNPWGCTSSDQVINEFFSTLGNYFKNESSDLAKTLMLYSQLLLDINLTSSWLTLLFKYITSDQKTISNVKEELQRKIGKIKRKVIITIDDVDRLEKDELFEILRLIRVTANFNNTLFLVTYDKEHVRKMLNANHIDSGDKFIKKIFPLEITMPSFETSTLPLLLINEVSQMIKEEKVIKAITNVAYWQNTYSEYTILRYLNNFRDVKRFAKSFSLNVSSFIKDNYYDINFTEFVFLELVRYTDLKVYEILRNQPFILFEKKINFIETSKFRLKPIDILKKEDIKISQQNYELLSQIFNRPEEKISSNSVIYYNNYEKYFSFRPLANKVDKREFTELMGKKRKIIVHSIRDWCTLIPNKIDSLKDVIISVDPKSFTELEEQKNYITSVLVFSLYSYSVNIESLFKSRLNRELYKEINRESLGAHLFNDMKVPVRLLKTRWRLNLSKLIAKLHSFYELYEGSESIQYQSIISDSQVKELAELNLNKFLNDNSKESLIYDITDKNTILGKLVESCVVLKGQNKDVDELKNGAIYECIVLDALIDFFKVRKGDDLKRFFNPFALNDENYYDSSYEAIIDDKLDQISKILGNKNSMKSFITNCFIVNEEVDDIYDFIKRYL